MSILAADMLGPGEILDCLWLSERAGSSESRRAARNARKEVLKWAPDAQNLMVKDNSISLEGEFIGILIFWVFFCCKVVIKLDQTCVGSFSECSVHIMSTVAHQGI